MHSMADGVRTISTRQASALRLTNPEPWSQRQIWPGSQALKRCATSLSQRRRWPDALRLRQATGSAHPNGKDRAQGPQARVATTEGEGGKKVMTDTFPN